MDVGIISVLDFVLNSRVSKVSCHLWRTKETEYLTVAAVSSNQSEVQWVLLRNCSGIKYYILTSPNENKIFSPTINYKKTKIHFGYFGLFSILYILVKMIEFCCSGMPV